MRSASVGLALLVWGCGARTALTIPPEPIEAVDAVANDSVGDDSASTNDSGLEDAVDASFDVADDDTSHVDANVDVGMPSTSAVEIGVGQATSCARTAAGLVRCWGSRLELGLDGAGVELSPTPPLAGLTDVVQLAIGLNQSCARIADGTVRCWGYAQTGILGDGVYPPKSEFSPPREVPGLTGVVDLSTAFDACARMTDGTVRCWGGCESGGTSCATARPTTLVGVDHVEQIVSGFLFHCVRRTEADVWCWGENRTGELGDGTDLPRSKPAPVPGLANVDLLAGGGVFGGGVCAHRTDGTLWCWGDRFTSSTSRVLIPTRVTGFAGKVRGLATNSANSCLIDDLGGVRCWGEPKYGAIGVAVPTTLESPVVVPGLSNVISLSMGGIGTAPFGAGPTRACAIPADGIPRCWGSELNGDGTKEQRNTPVKVSW